MVMTIENFAFAVAGAVVLGTLIIISIALKKFYDRLCFKDTDMFFLKKELGIYEINQKINELMWERKKENINE